MIKIARIMEFGPRRSFKIVLQWVTLYPFFLFLRFDFWHLKAVPALRPYRKEIWEALDGYFEPERILDVGCGLGFSLYSSRRRQRFVGYDTDGQVIKAARVLAKIARMPSVFTSNFDLAVEEAQNADLVLMINFLHDFSPTEARRLIASFKPKEGYVLVDQVSEEGKGYQFFHDFSNLDGFSIYAEFIVSSEHRRFLLLRAL